MFERFKRGTDADRGRDDRGGVATHEDSSERDRERTAADTRDERRFDREDRDGERRDERDGERRERVVARDRERERTRDHDDGRLDPATVRARQKDQFGGFNWGSAFFGWLVAVGVAALLVGLISAIGAATGLTSAQDATGTVGIVGGILLLLAMMLAYYAGGYVAGRMSRFDGARQGLGVWLIGLIVTIALAIAGAVLGAEYNVLQQLNLPRIPIDQGSLTTGGLIALAAIVIGTLLAAIAGGKVGQRYHAKVDRAGGLR